MENVHISHLTVHPAVSEVFRWVESLRTQGGLASLSPAVLSRLQRTSPFHAVRSGQGDAALLCFAGLSLLPDVRKVGQQRVWVVVHEDVSEDDVAELAWLHEIQRHLNSPHRSEILASLYEVVRMGPKIRRQQLLSDHGSSSPMTLTQQLTGETRAAVRNQCMPVAVESELEKLLGG